jgi:uncharacterized membrane protein YhaH (DUF805 family)
MNPRRDLTHFWVTWLFAASIGVALFGLVLVIAPAFARQGFSLLLYSDSQRIATFGEQAGRYVELVHAVLGAVMLGWGVALAIIVRTLVARRLRIGWQLIAYSMAA